MIPLRWIGGVLLVWELRRLSFPFRSARGMTSRLVMCRSVWLLKMIKSSQCR